MRLKSVRTSQAALSAACGAAAGLLAAWPAAAQEQGGAQLSEVVVTGSRIPRPNLEQPTPVVTLTPGMIQAAGPQDLGEIIARLPQAGNSGTLRANANNLGAGAGVSSINLRSLGLSRTLVLVDGQRHVAGDLSTHAVDLNSIPKALVDRVEVITGGASAIYGSDAVSGVVNIITKKSFEGIEAEAQTGGYDNGFGRKSSGEITVGRNLLDGRANIALSGFWTHEDGIDARDLPGAHNYGTIVNPADVEGALDPTFRFSGPAIVNDGIPDRLFVPNIASDLTTRTGVLVNIFNLSPISFDAAGHVVPTPARTGYNSFGYGQLPAGCQACYHPEDYLQVSSPLTTKGAALRGGLELGPHLRGRLDAKFVQSDAENTIQPSVSAVASDFLIFPDNAFLTPEIRSAMSPTGLYILSKFLNDGRTQDLRRRTWRLVASLEGEVETPFAEIRWNGALNYGETDARIVDHNRRVLANFDAALDSVIDPATGKPACRIDVPSAPQTGLGVGALNPSACVPYNPFGLQNSAAAMAYSFATVGIHDRLTQQTADFNVTFDTSRFLNLQGGPIGVATGAEYRMERTRRRNDPLIVSGAVEEVAGDSAGGFNVYEGYVEASAPVFRHAGPGLDELTFDAAWRGAHYSTVGDVGAYKVSGVWGPASWVKLRGTYSRAIRAPNITEAFLPSTPTFFNVEDPCSVENINTNVNFARNCAAAGLPAGFTATTFSIPGTDSGNTALRPEQSFSYTAGVVLQPPMARNLAVTLDYYSIKIKDAITAVQAQDIVDNCYGSSGGLDQAYCSLFTRDSARQLINSIHTTYVNASKLYTNGLELQVSYVAEVAPLTGRWRYTRGLDGRLAFNLTADYVMRLRNYPFQQNPGQVNVLEGTANTTWGDNPQLKGVAQLDYRQGPVGVVWSTRYVGRMALFNRDSSAADHSESLSIPFTEATFYHDLMVSWRASGTLAGTELYAGATNIFDERPPFTVINMGRELAGFDLGRFLFVGARYRR